MAAGDSYRAKAAELVGKAAREIDGHNRATCTPSPNPTYTSQSKPTATR